MRMKLVTFLAKRQRRLGALEGGKIIDLNAGYALYLWKSKKEKRAVLKADQVIPCDMISFLERGERALKTAHRVVDFLKASSAGKILKDPVGRRVIYNADQVKLMAPVPRPPLVIDAAFNSPDIIREAIAFGLSKGTPIDEPKKPAWFMVPPSCVIGPGDPIIHPKMSKHVMNSIELCVVIGKKAWKVPKENAAEYIAGYTIGNDVTMIDHQIDESFVYSLARAKSYPSFKPMGPCLVLKDQIKDPHNLRFVARVNGEVKQSGSTKENIFSVYDFVTTITQYHPLEVGSTINMGAYMGDEVRCTPVKIVIKPGDLTSNEIEGIGVLENPVIAEQ
jgi:acylpyruvate hydrolase